MASRAFSCRQWLGQWQQAMMPARTLALRRALFYLTLPPPSSASAQ